MKTIQLTEEDFSLLYTMFREINTSRLEGKRGELRHEYKLPSIWLTSSDLIAVNVIYQKLDDVAAGAASNDDSPLPNIPQLIEDFINTGKKIPLE